MSDENSNGLSLFSVLAVVFIILKLTKVIDWSWWWVVSPWWIPLAAVIFSMVGVLFFIVIADFITVFFGGKK